MSNVDSTTIVKIKRSGNGLWSIHVNQEPAKPDKLAGGVGKDTLYHGLHYSSRSSLELHAYSNAD